MGERLCSGTKAFYLLEIQTELFMVERIEVCNLLQNNCSGEWMEVKVDIGKNKTGQNAKLLKLGGKMSYK